MSILDLQYTLLDRWVSSEGNSILPQPLSEVVGLQGSGWRIRSVALMIGSMRRPLRGLSDWFRLLHFGLLIFPFRILETEVTRSERRWWPSLVKEMHEKQGSLTWGARAVTSWLLIINIILISLILIWRNVGGGRVNREEKVKNPCTKDIPMRDKGKCDRNQIGNRIQTL